MPWKESNAMSERERFLRDHLSMMWSITELSERYDISRQTAHKWLKRIDEDGVDGLKELSRKPHSSPNRTPDHVAQLLLATKHEHPSWGPKKVLAYLERRGPKALVLPARSTVEGIFLRHGLVQHRRASRRWNHPGRPTSQPSGPNDLWTVDFKGEFRTRDGIYCFPLTVVDLFSRYLLACKGLFSVRTEGVKPVFERLFREVGMPLVIRSDNGPPFASKGIHGLCKLNVWWMRLGIIHQRIQPSHPEQNGSHERMHRTLKRETARPPQPNLRMQQIAFDQFRRIYNDERPHEALDNETPSSRWESSPRPFPARILGPEYPGHFEIRRVSNQGCFRLVCGQHFLSNALAGEHIGLEEIADGIWSIYYYNTLLARFDERTDELSA
jgi:putative transposase